MDQAEKYPTPARFAFGENWRRFLSHIDERRIAVAQQSLADMFGTETFEGERFLDIGSGSGLFSLAARRLGAEVHSFDHDRASVACTEELARGYLPNDPAWRVEWGSVLDTDYVRSLGPFGLVYAWGVLHHTGDMWRALENTTTAVAPSGKLYLALYNDQGWISGYWRCVKRVYNTNVVGRAVMIGVHSPYLIGARFVFRALRGRLKLARGMSFWHDMLDWLGGYPFEVAKPAQVVDFCRERGLEAERIITCGTRHGCNEFVFARRDTPRL